MKVLFNVRVSIDSVSLGIQFEKAIKENMGFDARKPVFGGLRTTKAQTSLRIWAD